MWITVYYNSRNILSGLPGEHLNFRKNVILEGQKAMLPLSAGPFDLHDKKCRNSAEIKVAKN